MPGEDRVDDLGNDSLFIPYDSGEGLAFFLESAE
jgi:hypothetical protein